ncbi:MAG: chemotaxis protein CheX [bacterium]
MDPQQLQLFKRITLAYFAKLSPEDEPVLEAPYLQFGEPALLDYASLVRIRGEYEGCLYLTTPAPLLHSLLAINGETELSERTLRDMCRELSNVLSGNASQAFSGNWEISVPQSLGPGDLKDLRLPPSAFVMPLRWRGSRALLVIGLEPAARNGG